MFSVGDVVIIVGCDEPEGMYLVGTECSITAVVGRWYELDAPCHVPNGKWQSTGKYLRKKPPYDGNVKTSWDDLIVWKPKEVVTV